MMLQMIETLEGLLELTNELQVENSELKKELADKNELLRKLRELAASGKESLTDEKSAGPYIVHYWRYGTEHTQEFETLAAAKEFCTDGENAGSMSSDKITDELGFFVCSGWPAFGLEDKFGGWF